MRRLILVPLTLLLGACFGVAIKNPPVTIDEARLQSLPPGAGYTILEKQAEGLRELYRELASKGMNATDAIQNICAYDLAADRIQLRGEQVPPTDLRMWAFRVEISGDRAEEHVRKGWPVKRTEVFIAKRTEGMPCSVTTIVEDGLPAGEVEQRLVRIFSAGRQLGIQLDCRNLGGC